MLLTTIKLDSTICYWSDLFTEEELNKLNDYCNQLDLKTGAISKNITDLQTRKSNISWVDRDVENQWIFNKLDFVGNKINAKFFGFDIFHLKTLQYTVYDEEGSHYDWHWDIHSGTDTDNNTWPAEQRKITAVLQLSDPEDYEGGLLEVSLGGKTATIEKKKGFITLFPSFVLHKVNPVTKGTRKTLVAWFTGPDWR